MPLTRLGRTIVSMQAQRDQAWEQLRLHASRIAQLAQSEGIESDSDIELLIACAAAVTADFIIQDAEQFALEEE